MNKEEKKAFRILVLFFIFLNALFITGSSFLVKKGISQEVLIGGNLLFFIASLLSLFISFRASRSANPQSAVRATLKSFILKFFLIAIVAFAYIYTVKKEVNKPALIGCALLYIVYTFIEVSTLTRQLKQKKNA
jgi:ACR3 family arsenite efflux pump ArsB